MHYYKINDFKEILYKYPEEDATR